MSLLNFMLIFGHLYALTAFIFFINNKDFLKDKPIGLINKQRLIFMRLRVIFMCISVSNFS